MSGQMTGAFLGRSSDLARVERFLERIPTGPAGLMIAGEPGIGKTTLWGEAVTGALARSYSVLSCQPCEAEAKLSYAALADLLEGVGDSVLEDLPNPQRQAMEVALLRADSATARSAQRAVAAGFWGVLLRFARAGPLLLAVDDAQWLDPPSARVLEFALRRLGEAPVGVVVTTRGEGAGRWQLGMDRAMGTGRLDLIHLAPVTESVMGRILRRDLRAAFPRSIVRKIQEASGGNPFFALELGRALLRRGVGSGRGEGLVVPESLIELIHDRLLALPDRTRSALLTVAVASRPSLALVGATIGGPGRAAAALDPAVRAGVVVVTTGRIRFTHPLLGAVHYSQSALADRLRAHLDVAKVVSDPEERARHMALAAEGPDREVADALDAASLRASGRGAPDSAADLAELALAMTPSSRRHDLARRLVRAGEASFEANRVERAGELLERGAASLSPGTERAEALRRKGWVEYHLHGSAAALELFQRAREEAGEDPSLPAAVELDLALARETRGDWAAGARHAADAVRLARRAGRDDVQAEALTLVANQRFLNADPRYARTLARAVRLEEDSGGVRNLHSPLLYGADFAMLTDRLAEARSNLETLIGRARDQGDESSLPVLLLQRSRLECWAGNWPRSAEDADESCQIARWAGQDVYVSLALSAKAAIDALLGDEGSARRSAEEGLSLAERITTVVARERNLQALGQLELSLGNAEAAIGRLAPLAESALRVREPAALRFLPDHVEALISTGRLEAAGSLLRPFLERGRALGRAWVIATGERCMGLLAAASGDASASGAAFAVALEQHERVGQPLELGRTLLARGRTLRRRKQWGAAREALSGALQTFEGLGASIWAAATRAEVERIGGRPPAPRGLSATEGRVAELVASGMTNREVADALFLSVTTVEANLRRVYAKLGVRSRVALARTRRGEG